MSTLPVFGAYVRDENREGHVFLSFSKRTYLSYCQGVTQGKEYTIPADLTCKVCIGEYQMGTEPLKITGEGGISQDEYRTIFNGSTVDPVTLEIVNVKAVKDMTDEELTEWIYKIDHHVKVARIIAQAAKVNLEDRKLRYTKEQMDALKEFDRKYKPKPVPQDNDGLSTRDKKVAKLMELMGISKEEAEKQLDAKSAKKAATPKDPREKKIATLLNLGLCETREEAEAYLAAQVKE